MGHLKINRKRLITLTSIFAIGLLHLSKTNDPNVSETGLRFDKEKPKTEVKENKDNRAANLTPTAKDLKEIEEYHIEERLNEAKENKSTIEEQIQYFDSVALVSGYKDYKHSITDFPHLALKQETKGNKLKAQ